MRYIGLDLGKKTLGVSVSSLDGTVATPKITFRITSLEDALFKVFSLKEEYEEFEIALGLPLNSDDTVGEQAKYSLEFQKLLTENGFVVHLVDERNTTEKALEVIREMNVTKEKRKEIVDKIAAQFILKYFLERIKKSDGRK